jgi:hypothetical protein
MSNSATINSRVYFDNSEDKNSWIVEFEFSSADDSSGVSYPFLLETYCQKGQTISQNFANSRFVRVLTKQDLPNYTDFTGDVKTYSGYYQYRSNSFSTSFYSADAALSTFSSVKTLLKSLTNNYPSVPIEPLKVVPINLSTTTFRGRSSASVDTYPGDVVAFYCTGGTGEYQFGYDIDKFEAMPGSVTKLRVLENSGDTTLTVNIASGSFTKELTIQVVLPEGYSNTITSETVG